jgi:hypothetical protein
MSGLQVDLMLIEMWCSQVNRIIQTPPEPQEKVDTAGKRIVRPASLLLPLRAVFAARHKRRDSHTGGPILAQINANGETLPLDSPRMKFAIKHSGVSLPEIYPQVRSLTCPRLGCNLEYKGLVIAAAIAYIRMPSGPWSYRDSIGS